MSFQNETSLSLQDLGFDATTINWADLGTCSTIHPAFITDEQDIFFDLYEKDQNQARAVDEMCLRCPVIAECFNYGTENELIGVFGGFYLTKGRVDETRNKHKTEKVVKDLAEKIYDV